MVFPILIMVVGLRIGHFHYHVCNSIHGWRTLCEELLMMKDRKSSLEGQKTVLEIQQQSLVESIRDTSVRVVLS